MKEARYKKAMLFHSIDMDIRKSLEIVSDQKCQGQSRERLDSRAGSGVRKSLGSVVIIVQLWEYTNRSSHSLT